MVCHREDVYDMDEIILFGAGNTGKRVYGELTSKFKICCFLDNDRDKWNTIFDGIEVLKPSIENIQKYNFQYILICSVYGKEKIREQLLKLGITENKIRFKASNPDVLTPFLKNLSEIFARKNISGSVAEVGVFQGESAEKINLIFNNQLLHLFDTFEGFSERDCDVESKWNFSEAKKGQFDDTSIERVMERMPYPEKVIIHKGYFPDTTIGINDIFSFVRVDLDLYQPTVAALEYFDNYMTKGGVVLVHDYFGGAYEGIKKAVDDYVAKHTKLNLIPIGDTLSIAIIGY